MSEYNSARRYAMSYRKTITCELTEEEANDFIEVHGLVEHHTATVKGYTHKNTPQYAHYNGRLGEGVVKFGNLSSRFSCITYYL